MADRTVRVNLIAEVAGYIDGMNEAAEATRQLEGGAVDAEDRLQRQEEAMQEVAEGALVLGGALAAGVGLAVAAYAEFDEQVSNVEAAALDQADSWGALRDAAIEAGASTRYSAVEAAEGVEELVKAGLSAEDILAGGLNGALALAASDGLDVAFAAETAASAMTQFKLSGQDVTHIADLLAAGAGKAQGGVSDLAEALNQAGLVASGMGLSVDETIGTLTAFASAGLMGSDAGTSFRTMLMRLQAPTLEVSALMDELGLSAYDAQGNFVGMVDFAGQLQERLAGLTVEQRNSALATIFGQDAIRSASILYEQGAEGIAKWIDEVDSSGYAARQAALKMDNLKGDLEKLGGSWETLMIRMGESGDGPLRAVVQTLEQLVDTFAAAPPWMQAFVLGASAVTAGILLVGGTALVAIPQVVAFRNSLLDLGITAAGTRAALSLLASGAAGGAVGSMAGAFLAAAPIVAVVTDRLIASATAAGRAEAAFKLAGDAGAVLAASHQKWADQQGDNFFGLFAGASKDADDINRLVAQLDTATAAVAAYREAAARGVNTAGLDTRELNQQIRLLGELGESLAELGEYDAPGAAAAFAVLADETSGSDQALVNLLDSMPAYRDQLAEQAAELGIVHGEVDTYGEKVALAEYALDSSRTAGESFSAALEEQSAIAEDATGTVESLSDALRDYNEVLYDTLNAEMDWYEAVDAATEAIAENGATLDVTTEAGRSNKQALMDLAQASRENAAAIYESTGSVQEMEAALQAGWQQVYETALAMGASEEQAVEYANTLNGIPSEISTQIQADTAAAAAAIDSFILSYQGKVIDIYVNAEGDSVAVPSGSGAPSGSSSGGGAGMALGGAVYGAGVKGVDSVPTMLAPGEHVLTDREVDLMGGQGAVYAWRAALRAGRVQGMAGGGAVGASVMSSSVSNSSTRSLTVNVNATGQPGMDIDAIATLAANKVVGRWKGRG